MLFFDVAKELQIFNKLLLKVGAYATIYVIYLCVACAWGKMYNFRFTLKNDKAMELFYEYVITECRKHFGVQNKNVIFRVNYNRKEDFLIPSAVCKICEPQFLFCSRLMSGDIIVLYLAL